MKEKSLLILICAVVICAVGFTVTLRGDRLAFLEGEAITVSTKTPQAQPTPRCSILDKILEPDPDFDKIDLKVGDRDISYVEEKFIRDTEGNITFDILGQIRKEKVQRNDPEREVALKLLDVSTCQTVAIKVKKVGAGLIAPPGYEIEVYERLSGLSWNAHNTFYKVNKPSNTIVIRNVWPDVKYENHKITVIEKKKKVRKTVRVSIFDKNKVYVPYSDGLADPDVIEKGINDLKNIVSRAKEKLRDNHVMSRAFPEKLVADVLPDEYYWRRPILEQSDLGEFVLDPENTAHRVFVILGTNGSAAWSTCNFANACGLYQFTGSTYAGLVKKYTKVGLIKDFKVGALDHVNSAMAAMLLDDLNLADLVKTYGIKIYSDKRLEEYLAASYNGAPKWVFKSLNATLSKNISEWTRHLKSETKGFMIKLRYLKENSIPS